MTDTTHGAFGASQSLSNKIWRKLGYFGQFDEALFDWRQDVPKGGDLLTTDTRVQFSLGDRLRLLLSGRCEVTTYTKTRVEVRDVETRSEVRVMP